MAFDYILNSFAEKLRVAASLSSGSLTEDQLKAPVCDLLSDYGSLNKLKINSATEKFLPDLSIRPDVAIYSNRLICGYIELKRPGKGADPKRFTDKHDKLQWEKIKELPNVMYTDGIEWSHYRFGERVGKLIRCDDAILKDGKKAIRHKDIKTIANLFQVFTGWQPIVPSNPNRLAEFLAPMTRLIKEEVEIALTDNKSAITLLKNEWKHYFFPDVSDEEFSDSYAQTITYSLLLARLSGATDLNPTAVSLKLQHANNLLAASLKILAQTAALSEIRMSFDLLQRSLSALDTRKIKRSGFDFWLYFYEDFLSVYDPKLRQSYGVYYTPKEVVELQVLLTREILRSHFGKPYGFADEGVTFLDPASGTGTYLVSAVKQSLKAVEDDLGPGAVPARAVTISKNLYAFEILVGPYTVSHLRISNLLEDAINHGSSSSRIPFSQELQIYLADTLDSPYAAPPGTLTLTHKALTEESEKVRAIKSSGEVYVIIGNPPYDRQQLTSDSDILERKGGWVRFGDRLPGEEPILNDFIETVTSSGGAVHLKNLYNDYVYFWRWAIWRINENKDKHGIISFITASSFLSGPAFSGMRKMMRETFENIWVIDLKGDSIGTRKSANVFSIRSPVCITICSRPKGSVKKKLGKVSYTAVTAPSAEDKLKVLTSIKKLADFTWADCFSEDTKPFMPKTEGDFLSWPKLENLVPFSHSGAQYKRRWPISPNLESLLNRWDNLASAHSGQQNVLFRATTARKFSSVINGKTPLSKLAKKDVQDLIQRYGFRSFDRQYAFLDDRFADRFRPDLFNVHSSEQVYFVSMTSKVIGDGPTMTLSAEYPDTDYFCGRGGKDVFPMFRDHAGREVNLNHDAYETIKSKLGSHISKLDLTCYIYAVLSSSHYSKTYWEELSVPGVRVPITKDPKLFDDLKTFGEKRIWLHSFCKKFSSKYGKKVPRGKVKCTKAIGIDETSYPSSFQYDEVSCTLKVGDGEFTPVSPEVWDFSVSGLKVVQSWLKYRMKDSFGKKTSPLDDINVLIWTAQQTLEFLELIWLLEKTIEQEAELIPLLDTAFAGSVFSKTHLPLPKKLETKGIGPAPGFLGQV